jgi:aldehyde dehydrogenase (NAD+)
MLSHQVPFGGFKQSGWGRELGVEVRCPSFSVGWLALVAETNSSPLFHFRQGLEPYLTTKAVHYYYGDDFEWPIKL